MKRLNSTLFLVEFVRGALLISFLPVYATDQLGFSISIVGFAISAHYLSDTAVKCFVGYLLQRFPSRWIIQIGMLISVLGLLFIQYSHSPWQLITASAVVGIGISPLWLICLSRVDEVNRAAQMGALYTSWLIGLGSGVVVTNLLIDHSYSLTFWLFICFMIGSWVLLSGIDHSKQSLFNQHSLVVQLKMLQRGLRTMKPLIPGMILQTTAAGMLLPILPGFVTRRSGLSHTEYAFTLLIGGALTIAFLIPMGKWSDLWGRKWFLVCGFGIFSFALYGFTLVTSSHMLIALAALMGISYAAVLPAWNALSASYIPKNQQAIGWGLFSSIEGLGVIVGPMIGGWLAHLYSDSVVILASALLLAGISLFYFFLPAFQFQEQQREAFQNRLLEGEYPK